MTNRIPEAIQAVARRFGTINPIAARPSDPLSFFRARPATLRAMSQERRASVERLCGCILSPSASRGNTKIIMRDGMEQEPPDRDGIEALVNVYAYHAGRHAFEGTVLISMMERIRRKGGDGLFSVVRKEFFERRDTDPLAWELAHNCGRPSVPKNVTAVFALYQAERQLARPLHDISTAQMEALGLL